METERNKKKKKTPTVPVAHIHSEVRTEESSPVYEWVTRNYCNFWDITRFLTVAKASPKYITSFV